MAYPWTKAIRQLRRRALAAGAVEGVGRVAPVVTVLAIAYVAWSLGSPWGRYLAPVAGGLLALALVGAAVAGMINARRSEIYLAKWIDMRSGLDDRLTSAVEWSSLQLLGDFQRRCIEELAMQLGARFWTLTLPRTAPRGWPVTVVLLVIIASLPLALVRRNRAPSEKDARAKAVVAATVARSAATDAAELDKQSQLLKEPRLEQLSAELSSVLQEIDQGRLTRERSLERLERLRSQVERAGLPRSGGADARGERGSGPVGALARALDQGNARGAAEALVKLEAALRGGELSDDEAAALHGILDGLKQVARPVDGGVAAKLDDAIRRLAAGDQAGAAASLAEVAADKLATLERPLATAAAMQKARAAIDSVTRAIGQAVIDESATPGGRTESATAEGARSASGDMPTQRVADTAAPRGDERTNPVAVRGTWNGQVMRQLYDSASATARSDELKRLLVEHDRVVEERFRRDEVPQEYEEAVRAYFAALHAKGR